MDGSPRGPFRTGDGPFLHVEGEDDKHSLIHLLIRHELPFDQRPLPDHLPLIKVHSGVDKLLDVFVESVQFSKCFPAGFVLDADLASNAKGLSSRWSAIADRLRKLGVEPPAMIPPSGLVIPVPKYRTTVGVWIMPDNQRDGRLEEFLHDLITEGDPLISFAEESAQHARDVLGALFSQTHQSHASLYTWLAWQAEPGCSYGQALKARYLRHDSATALKFVDWFRSLYPAPLTPGN